MGAAIGLVAVAKNKFAKGFDGTERKVRDAYEILPVQEALQRVYPTDAHLVTYVVKRAQWQPRTAMTAATGHPWKKKRALSVQGAGCQIQNDD